MKKLLVLVILVSLSARLSADNDFCGITNLSFRTGENITLVVFYNALGLYVNAGTANFTVTPKKLPETY